MFSIKNGKITIEGSSNRNVREMFNYLKPKFPGIQIEERKGVETIVGVHNPMIIIALQESSFYNAEEPIDPCCV